MLLFSQSNHQGPHPAVRARPCVWKLDLHGAHDASTPIGRFWPWTRRWKLPRSSKQNRIPSHRTMHRLFLAPFLDMSAVCPVQAPKSASLHDQAIRSRRKISHAFETCGTKCARGMLRLSAVESLQFRMGKPMAMFSLHPFRTPFRGPSVSPLTPGDVPSTSGHGTVPGPVRALLRYSSAT